MPNTLKAKFSVHPSVVFQLGESLISDAVQAIIELVKNCYDADATYAKVTIDTKGITNRQRSYYPANKGTIIIEDNGHGMTLDQIQNGWLTISNRHKRTLKESKQTTPGGRTPLGDKGLGRLGVQRLGENLEILTKPATSDDGYHIGFSWADFNYSPSLDAVAIKLEQTDFPSQKGTQIIITDLKEPETWEGEGSIRKLQQELSRMISPYKKIRNFEVYVEVNGSKLDLVEISEQLRDIAPIHYDICFDGATISISGRATLNFFRDKNLEDFALFVESDSGRTFANFLLGQKKAQAINLTKSNNERWFVEFSFTKEILDIDNVELLTSGELANPGAFNGEVEAFDLGPDSFRQQSIYDKISEYRKHIKEIQGIRIYRDGFAVRVDNDWLELGSQWTSATSFYTLKPDTTIGYIALSAKNNINLEEMTDREGFKNTPYFRNFMALMKEFRKYTEQTQECLRRSWLEFRTSRVEARSNIDSRRTIEEISSTIAKELSFATKYQKELREITDISKPKAESIANLRSRIQTTGKITPDLQHEIAISLEDISRILLDIDNKIEKTTSFLAEIDSIKEYGEILNVRIANLKDQMNQLYETVALGLIAESLSHEVYNIADQLSTRTKAIQGYINKGNITEASLSVFVQYIQSSVAALRKQISFLSPSLRYVREQRQDIEIFSFITDISKFYTPRLSSNGLKLNIIEPCTSFSVKMNMGKLTQILDNLIANSEYWLKEDIKQKRIKEGVISIEIVRPFLRICDNGRGIDKNLELILFEPFITGKGKEKGRGLGLFITKQLLDSIGCHIGLLPERNANDRLYIFQLDLRGAIINV